MNPSRPWSFRAASLFVAIGATASCSSSPSSTGGPGRDGGSSDAEQGMDQGATALGDAAPSSDGPIEAEADASTYVFDAGPICNALSSTGTPVPQQNVASAAPVPMGGPLPGDGTYVLTASSIYTGPGGASGPTGLSVQWTEVWSGVTASGGNYQRVNVSSTSIPYTESGAFTVSGTMLTVTPSCPDSRSSTALSYDSDGTTTLTEYFTTAGRVHSRTFTRQ